MSEHHEPQPFARAALKLFQGPISDDESTWEEVLKYQYDLRRYLSQIGITMVMNEKEGFAYLTQENEDAEDEKLPRLIRRRPLSYEVTLLCVLIKQRLDQFDQHDLSNPKLFLNRDEIIEEMELLLPSQNNEAQLHDKIDTYIRAAVEMGFLKKVRKDLLPPDAPDRYEVRRLINARFTTETLARILDQLQPSTTPDDANQPVES